MSASIDRTSSRRRFLADALSYASVAAGEANAMTGAPFAPGTRLQERVRVRALARHIPAIAMAYGTAEHSENFALGRASSSSPASSRTIFEAASLSKPAFAMGVLHLVNSGDLALDEPIATWVDLRAETSDPRVLRITPRHALSHSTGLPNWRHRVEPLRTTFEPGSAFSYSGEGIFLLQRAVEHVTGMGLAIFMRRHVLEPLGMRSSTYAFEPSLAPRMAAPYDAEGRPSEWRTVSLGRQLARLATERGLPFERWRWNDVRDALPRLDPPQRPLPIFSTINAASSLLTTAADYLRITAAVARHPQMTAPQIAVTERIAWGVGIGLERPRGLAFHWGDNDGFKAMMIADIARRRGAVVLTNSDGGMSTALSSIEDVAGPGHPALPWVGAMYA